MLWRLVLLNFCKKNDLDFLVKVGKWFGGKKVFGQDRNQSHAVDERTLAYLCDYYESDVVRFLELTARDPAIWGWRNGGKMDGQG